MTFNTDVIGNHSLDPDFPLFQHFKSLMFEASVALKCLQKIERASLRWTYQGKAHY